MAFYYRILPSVLILLAVSALFALAVAQPVQAAGQPRFEVVNAIGETPLTVQFSDVSTVTNVTTRRWDFGDGVTSNVTSPSHTYTEDGVYTVTLTLVTQGGNQVYQKTDAVRAARGADDSVYSDLDSGAVSYASALLTGCLGMGIGASIGTVCGIAIGRRLQRKE
jgi:hypothetical protein